MSIRVILLSFENSHRRVSVVDCWTVTGKGLRELWLQQSLRSHELLRSILRGGVDSSLMDALTAMIGEVRIIPDRNAAVN